VRKVLVLAAKEFRGFLRMPLGYALLAVYALVGGMVLMTLLYMFHDQLLRVAQQAQMARAARPVVDVQMSVVTPYLLNAAALLVFVVPFLTMRSFAEEKRSRSLEVLVSYPLSAWQIVAGKFLGVYAFCLLMLVISLGHLALLTRVSNPEVPALLVGLLGLLLLAAALVAMGLFVSSLTTGQVEAAVLTLGLFLVLVMAGELAGPGTGGLPGALRAISPLGLYQPFGRGMLPWDGLLALAAAAVFFTALTLRGVDLLKWRG
jgi:ABC-2 type transport system permease protein